MSHGQVLDLPHPHALVRDTSTFRPLRPEGVRLLCPGAMREPPSSVLAQTPEMSGTKKTPSLKRLAEHWLKETIQDGHHDSVEDHVALELPRCCG